MMTRRGFTLVEITIAAVLGAMVTLTALAAVRAVTSGKERVEAFSEANAELRYIVNLLRRDFASLYRNNGIDEKFVGELIISQTDNNSDITFFTVSPTIVRQGHPQGDVVEVQYTMMRNDEGRPVMVRREWPNPDLNEEPGGVVTVLSERVAYFRTRYLDDRQWRSDWPQDMGKACNVMEVTLAVEVPGGKQVMARSFLMDLTRRYYPETDASVDTTAPGLTEGAPQ